MPREESDPMMANTHTRDTYLWNYRHFAAVIALESQYPVEF